MLRSRWAALGAAVAVSFGAGGFGLARATNPAEAVAYVPITPCRLFDTRPVPNNVGSRAAAMGPTETHTFTVWGANGNCAIPTTATAITINLTAAPNATSNTYLTMWPTGAAQPLASNLNVKQSDTAATPNLATVTLSATGQFSLFNSAGQVHVIGDILGYYTDHHHDDRYYTEAEVDSALAETPNSVPPVSPQQIAQLQWWPGSEFVAPSAATPAGVAYDGTSIWVANHASNTVQRHDPATGAEIATVLVGSNPRSIGFDGTSIWVTNFGGGTVSKIDPATNAVTATVTVGTNPLAVAFDGEFLWVTNYGSGNVSKISVVSNSVVATLAVGTNPTGVAFDGRHVWVANEGPDNVMKIERGAPSVVATVAVGSNPNGLAFDGVSMWVANRGVGTLSVLNVSNNAVATTVTLSPTFAQPIELAFDGTAMWVTGYDADAVYRVSATTYTVTHRFGYIVPVPTAPIGIAFDGTSMWVANSGNDTLSRYYAA